jgi:hypothetical protein
MVDIYTSIEHLPKYILQARLFEAKCRFVQAGKFDEARRIRTTGSRKHLVKCYIEIRSLLPSSFEDGDSDENERKSAKHKLHEFKSKLIQWIMAMFAVSPLATKANKDQVSTALNDVVNVVLHSNDFCDGKGKHFSSRI